MSQRKRVAFLIEGGLAISILCAFTLFAWTDVVETEAKFEFDGLQGWDQLGGGVAVIGDTNGDGYHDYLVSAPSAHSHLSFTPDASGYTLFISGKNGKRLGATWGGPFDSHGWAVAGLNDIDGDTLSEAVVGSPNYTDGAGMRGKVNIYTQTHTFELPAQYPNEPFGQRVSRAGDVNGDGKEDLLVRGGNRVFLFSGDQISQGHTVPIATLENNGFWQGYAISGAGDLNRDGFSDIAVKSYTAGQPRVYVYYGQPDGLQPTLTMLTSAIPSFGDAIAAAGDLNRDGYGDLAVGAQFANAPAGFSAGKVLFFAGGPSGVATSPFAEIDGSIHHSFLGNSLAAAGDSNCDGKREILVGSRSANAQNVHLYAYDMVTQTFILQKTFVVGNGANYGYSVSASTQITLGQTKTNIIIGASYTHAPLPYQEAVNWAGKAHVFELSCSRRSLLSSIDPL